MYMILRLSAVSIFKVVVFLFFFFSFREHLKIFKNYLSRANRSKLNYLNITNPE